MKTKPPVKQSANADALTAQKAWSKQSIRRLRSRNSVREQKRVRRNILQKTKTRYFHPNHLGSVKIVTKTDGSVDANYKYEPYGALLAAKSTGTDITKYKYTGQEEDSGTGLYNYSTRYYDPEIGRFISPDSMVPDPGDTQAFNRYMYANNNPVRFNDPTGHYSEEGGADPGDWGYNGTRNGNSQMNYSYTNSYSSNSGYMNVNNYNFNNSNLFPNVANNNDTLGTGKAESPVKAPWWATDVFADEKNGTIEQKWVDETLNGSRNNSRVNLNGGYVSDELYYSLTKFTEETGTYLVANSATREWDDPSSPHSNLQKNACDFRLYKDPAYKNMISPEATADLAAQSALFTGIEIGPAGAYSSTSPGYVHVDISVVRDRNWYGEIIKGGNGAYYDNSGYRPPSPFWSNYFPGKYAIYGWVSTY